MPEAAKFDEGKFPEEVNNAPVPSTRNVASTQEVADFISVPGVICSRFYFAVQDMSIVRIVFADEAPNPNNIDPATRPCVPRFGVAMNVANFINFAQIVQNTANALMNQLMKNQQSVVRNPVPSSDPEREKLD